MAGGEIRSTPAGQELDALVAEKVMGWHKIEHIDPEIAGAKASWMEGDTWRAYADYWSPSTNIAAAWGVHKSACRLIFSRRKAYYAALQDIVSDRVTRDTPLKVVIAWPDVLTFVQPEDFCRAALLAVNAAH